MSSMSEVAAFSRTKLGNVLFVNYDEAMALIIKIERREAKLRQELDKAMSENRFLQCQVDAIKKINFKWDNE